MKTVHDLLRARLEAKAGLGARRDPRRVYAELVASEWSDQFERLMRNRLIMGALRYGPMGSLNKPPYDRMAGIIKRWFQYRVTGNTECLVDIANLALLEFEEGHHPEKHFRAIHEDHCCA